MNVFEWLFIAHLAGDYLFQTEFQAAHKASGRFFNKALFSHCATYTLCFVPAFFVLSLNSWWLVLVFASHLFLDRRWPVILWRKCVKRESEEHIAHTFGLTIAIDQVFHILILALIAVLR